MPSKDKVGGSWRDVTRKYAKAGGEWRAVKERYVKVGGVWRQVGGYFYAEPYLLAPTNFNGTYKAGVLSDGNFGAEMSGGLGNQGLTVRIGIRIPGIPNWTPVKFRLVFDSDNAISMPLYALNEYGTTITTWNSIQSGTTVEWPYWSGTELILCVQPSSSAAHTASFRVSDIYINGVKK